MTTAQKYDCSSPLISRKKLERKRIPSDLSIEEEHKSGSIKDDY
jgi:hypothetical protein